MIPRTGAETLPNGGENIETRVRDIPGVREDLVSLYGEVVLSQTEALALEAGNLPDERLEELFKAQIAQRDALAAELDEVATTQEALGDAIDASNAEAIGAQAEAANIIASIGEGDDVVAGDDGDDNLTQIATGAGIPTEVAKDLRDDIKSGFDIIRFAEEHKFLGGIAKGIFWILSWFGVKNPFDVVAEVDETVDGVVGDAQQVREGVGTALQEATEIPEALRTHPALQAKLDELLQNPNIISPEELTAIKAAANGGEIDIATIKGALSAQTYENLISAVLEDPEMTQIVKEIIISELSESVIEAYPHINLRPESRDKLQVILREHLGDNSAQQLASDFLSGQQVSFGEILASAPKYGLDAAGLMISLVAGGVISISDIALDISDEVVNFTLTAVGIIIPGISIPINEFTEKLEGMDDAQRGVFLAVMYRQSGPFVRLISNVMGGITRTIIDGLNTNSLDTNKWDLAFGNADAKLANFTKISQAVSGIEGKHLGEGIQEGVKILQRNYQIQAIMESGDDIGDLTRRLNDFDPTILGANTASSIDQLRNLVANKIQIPDSEVFTLGRHLHGYFPGVTQAEDTLMKSMQNIAEYQRAKVTKSALARIWNYPSSLLDELRLAQRGERLVFEGLDQAGALSKMQQLKKLATEFPDVFRHTLGVFPEIAFLGLDITMRDDDTSFLEATRDSLLYMTGIIGPIKLIFSGGAQLREGELQWYNFAAAGAGTALFAMDAINAGRIITREGFSVTAGGRIGREIVLRPITNIINAGANLGKFGRGIGRVALGTGSIDWASIGRSMRNARIPKRGKLAALAAAVVGGYYLGGELLTPDISDEYHAMIDAGVIDIEGNVIDSKQVKTMIAELSEREKTALAEIVVASSLEGVIPIEGNLNISVDDRTVIASAENSLTGEWALSPEVRDYFSQLGLETRFETYTA